MQISENELRAILEEVEAELSPLLRSEREKLSKAVGDEVSSSASASPMGEESKSAGRDMLPGERSPSLADEKSASAGAPPAEGSASAGGPEASAGGDEGVQELAAQYAQLSPEELEMHLMALQAAMQKLMGGAEGSAGAAAPAGAPPAAPEASASAGMPPMMGKAEKSASPAIKKEGSVSASASASEKSHAKKEVPAEKSASYAKKEHSEESSSKEESSSVSKSELDAVNAKLDVALKAVEFLTRPMRKAVTEFVSEEKPAANLSKNEVTAKLRAACSNPALAKSDRDLVNGFYDGRVSLDRISHLLK